MATENYSKVEDNIRLEAETAYCSYTQALQKVRLTGSSLQKAKESERLAMEKYKEGHLSIVEVINAQLYHLDANINYIQSPLSGAYAYTLSEPIYRLTEGEGYIYTVTPLKLVVTIDQHGDNYLVTYYEGSVDDENIIRQIAVTFVNTNTNLYLVIGGEGTYMENIAVTINGDAATPNRTTSGSKTELSAPPAGYEAIA